MTSCRKVAGKLQFHVDYDDGDSEMEELGAAGSRFRWHGPRGASGERQYRDAMRTAMLALAPQNLARETDAADAPADDVRPTPHPVSYTHLTLPTTPYV